MGKVARVKFISLPVFLAFRAKRTKKRKRKAVVPGNKSKETRDKSKETRAKTSSRFLATLITCQTRKAKTASPKRPTSVIKVKTKELAVENLTAQRSVWLEEIGLRRLKAVK